MPFISAIESVSDMFFHASVYQYPGALHGNESTLPQKIWPSERR